MYPTYPGTCESIAVDNTYCCSVDSLTGMYPIQPTMGLFLLLMFIMTDFSRFIWKLYILSYQLLFHKNNQSVMDLHSDFLSEADGQQIISMDSADNLMDLTEWQILECLQCQKSFIEYDSDEEVNQESICEECLQKLTSQDKKLILQTQFLEEQVNFLNAYIAQSALKQQNPTEITGKNDQNRQSQDLQLKQMDKQLNHLHLRQQQLDQQRQKLLQQLRQLQIQEENELNQLKKSQIQIVKIAENIECLMQENIQLQDYRNQLKNTSLLSKIFEIKFNNQLSFINGEVINETNICSVKSILALLFLEANYKPQIISKEAMYTTKTQQEQFQIINKQIQQIIDSVSNIISELFHFFQFIKVKYKQAQAQKLTQINLPFQILLQPEIMINKTNFECESNLKMIVKYLLTNIQYLLALNFKVLDEAISRT